MDGVVAGNRNGREIELHRASVQGEVAGHIERSGSTRGRADLQHPARAGYQVARYIRASPGRSPCCQGPAGTKLIGTSVRVEPTAAGNVDRAHAASVLNNEGGTIVHRDRGGERSGKRQGAAINGGGTAVGVGTGKDLRTAAGLDQGNPVGTPVAYDSADGGVVATADRKSDISGATVSHAAAAAIVGQRGHLLVVGAEVQRRVGSDSHRRAGGQKVVAVDISAQADVVEGDTLVG